MLKISNTVELAEWEIELTAIRAMGSGGQKVNKTSSAIHLRFDIKRSTLPQFYKERLLAVTDSRITKDGVIIIKAQQYRTQEQNREDALLSLKKSFLPPLLSKRYAGPQNPPKLLKLDESMPKSVKVKPSH